MSCRDRGLPQSGTLILVDIPSQAGLIIVSGKLEMSCPVSSAKKGVGTEPDSFKTPPGLHRVADRFGDQAPSGQVFRSRKPVKPSSSDSDEDQITTRILYLEGLEPGRNRGVGCDSFARFIYLHGTPHEEDLGHPASHGCIRFSNKDIIRLFEICRDREAWCWIIPD